MYIGLAKSKFGRCKRYRCAVPHKRHVQCGLSGICTPPRYHDVDWVSGCSHLPDITASVPGVLVAEGRSRVCIVRTYNMQIRNFPFHVTAFALEQHVRNSAHAVKRLIKHITRLSHQLKVVNQNGSVQLGEKAAEYFLGCAPSRQLSVKFANQNGSVQLSSIQLPLTYNLHNITHLTIEFFPLHIIYTYQ